AGAASAGFLATIGLDMFDLTVLIAGVIVLFAVSMVQRKGSVRKRLFAAPFALRAGVVIAVLAALILLGAYGPGYDVGQFIYNRF
nr:MBOAT family protein [Lachnospiraceae bacterium]